MSTAMSAAVTAETTAMTAAMTATAVATGFVELCYLNTLFDMTEINANDAGVSEGGTAMVRVGRWAI